MRVSDTEMGSASTVSPSYSRPSATSRHPELASYAPERIDSPPSTTRVSSPSHPELKTPATDRVSPPLGSAVGAAVLGAGSQPTLTTTDKVIALARGAGGALVDTVKGIASVVNFTSVELPKAIVERAVTRVGYLFTEPLPVAVQKVIEDDKKLVQDVVHAAAETVKQVVDAPVTAVKTAHKVATDPAATAKDWETLGRSATDTVITVATIVDAGAVAAKVGAVPKIGYTTGVAVKASGKQLVIEGAQSTKVLVQGADAAKIASNLASAANRPLLNSLDAAGQKLATALPAAARGEIGEKVAADVAKAMGADVLLPSKIGRNGIDVVATSGTGNVAVVAEAKSTTSAANQVTVQINARRPAPGVAQGTPDYNQAYLDTMKKSAKPELKATAQAVEAASQKVEVITSVNASGMLRVVNGETVQKAAANGGKAVGGSVQSGVIRPEATVGEKVAVGAAAAAVIGVVGRASVGEASSPTSAATSPVLPPSSPPSSSPQALSTPGPKAAPAAPQSPNQKTPSMSTVTSPSALPSATTLVQGKSQPQPAATVGQKNAPSIQVSFGGLVVVALSRALPAAKPGSTPMAAPPVVPALVSNPTSSSPRPAVAGNALPVSPAQLGAPSVPQTAPPAPIPVTVSGPVTGKAVTAPAAQQPSPQASAVAKLGSPEALSAAPQPAASPRVHPTAPPQASTVVKQRPEMVLAASAGPRPAVQPQVIRTSTVRRSF